MRKFKEVDGERQSNDTQHQQNIAERCLEGDFVNTDESLVLETIENLKVLHKKNKRSKLDFTRYTIEQTKQEFEDAQFDDNDDDVIKAFRKAKGHYRFTITYNRQKTNF